MPSHRIIMQLKLFVITLLTYLTVVLTPLASAEDSRRSNDMTSSDSESAVAGVPLTICFDFRLGTASFDPSYSNNRRALASISDLKLRLADPCENIEIVGIELRGNSSPDGSSQINRRLSARRLATLESALRSGTDIPDSIITRTESYIPWDELRARVAASDMPQKEEVIAIIDSEPRMVPYTYGTTIDDRVKRLRRLDGGRAWSALKRDFFPAMRSATAHITTASRPIAEDTTGSYNNSVSYNSHNSSNSYDSYLPVVAEEIAAPAEMPAPFLSRFYLKTNALGWAMLMSNITAEIDIRDHWSFQIPVYYSAMNYFTSTVKFRLFLLQPELRYWFSPTTRNDGPFIGFHLAMSHFDFAFGGDHRYQDHNRRTPALGGGLSGGYRMPLGHSRRWMLEFSGGIGLYHLHYDVFINKHNGRRIDVRRKNYLGLDQAAVSFVYTFDIGKGGRK